jgi:hypothetical protein
MGTNKLGWTVAIALLLAAVCAYGLAAIGGGARNLLAPALTADVEIAPFPLPTGFGIDPDLVSDELSRVFQLKAEEDVALRLALGGGAQQKLKDVVLPRLFSSTSVRAIVREVPQLAGVLAIGTIRRSAVVGIGNRGPAVEGLALTAPGIVFAEADGVALEIVTAEGGLTAVDLGPMAGDARKIVTLWLDERAEIPRGEMLRLTRLGVDGEAQGLVRIAGAAPWSGADLEVLPMARWLIMTILGLGLVAGLFVIAGALAGPLMRSRRG